MQGGIRMHRVGLIALFAALQAFAQITVNPSRVNLAASLGGTRSASQTVTVASAGQPLQFTASTRTFGAATDWLSVTPDTGTTGATLTITADASKLTAGTYTGQVTISAGPLQFGAVVDVVFTVGSNSAAAIAADPSGLTFIGDVGTTLPLASQNIVATGKSGAVLGITASATSSGNWLSVFPPSGITPATFTVTVNPAGLAAGRYTGTVTLSPNGGGTPTVVPVALALGAANAQTPELTLSQTAVTIDHQIGASAPPAQLVGVDVTTGGASQFTASGSASWLRLVSPLNPSPSVAITDALPGPFSILIDPAGLGVGTYFGTVTVSAAGLTPLQLPVTLRVTSTANLNASPSSVVFSGANTLSTDIAVSGTGGANLAFTAVTNPPVSWLTVTPASGATGTGSQTITLTANTSGQPEGTYTTNLVLSAQGGAVTLTVPVQLRVKPASTTATTLTYSSTTVELSTLVGGDNPSQAVFVNSSVGTAPTDFTAVASSAGGWLTVDPFLDVTPAKLVITANAAAAPGVGTQTGTVTVTSLATGARDTIAVQFTLAAPAISVRPTSLTFTQPKKGITPPPQTIQIRANTQSTYSISATAPWIKVVNLTGVVPADVSVAVDPTGLNPGTQTGVLQITGRNNKVDVQVSLVVAEAPAPTASPDVLKLSYVLGNPNAIAQPISVGSTGDPVRFTATTSTDSGVNWLSVDVASGTTPATLTAKVNTALLVPGPQTGSITLSSSDPTAKPRSIPVTLNVSASSVAVQGVLSAATLAPTSVAPGQIVTITGTGLGPAAGVVASPSAAGAIDTRLGDVQVFFDGIAAPLLFVRADQINAVAPYALFGRATARVQVVGGNTNYSVPIEVRVVDAAPGLFTTTSGRGQAAALNADYTANSLANPAPRGSVISLFGTGEGQTDPPGQDGRIILTDLRRPRWPVSAKVGGRNAQVLYFGSAPTLVSGVFQVNVRIPDDVETGSVPIEIQVGDQVTQSAVTIAVR